MSRTVVHRLVIVVAVLALMGVGCGTTSGDENAADVTSSVTADDDSTGSQGDEQGGDSQPASDAESPIADLLGVPLNDDDAMEEYFGQLQRDAERKVSECMLAQGFEYTAVDYSQFASFDSALDEDSREYAEQFGFGVASNPFDEVFSSFEEFVDPNAEYLESLSPGEADAYQAALNGAPPEGDPSDAGFVFEPSGCQGTAYDEAFSFASVFEEFADEIDAAEQAFEADSRIVTARAGWSSCMADAGYSYAEQEDAVRDFERRYEAIVGVPGAYEEEPELAELDENAGLSEIEIFGPRSLAPEAQNQVDALAVVERAAAVASWECNEPLREIEGDVQREYEQRFVDEHGATIRSMLDS